MSSRAPLAGTVVVDISRNVPGPYASLLLARLGAEVITVTGGPTGEALPELSVGKRPVTLNLRSQPGVEALHALVRDADVFLEGFRPGVAERLGAGYAQLSEVNPRLVYCSLTGYGQDGPARERAGHDINYLALTGVLGCLGPPDGPPLPPLNLVADLGGGGLWAVLGILGALLERERTGRGRFVDAAMVDGVLSMMGTWFAAWGTSVLPGRGRGLVGGEAPFYRCYRCADGRYVAVGAIEPKFFAALWRLLDLAGPVPDHLDPDTWPALTETLAARFAERDRDAWAALAESVDACLTPVLEPSEVADHPHMGRRVSVSRAGVDPFPRVDWLGHADPVPRADCTEEVLRRAGLTEEAVAAVQQANAELSGPALRWPPLR